MVERLGGQARDPGQTQLKLAEPLRLFLQHTQGLGRRVEDHRTRIAVDRNQVARLDLLCCAPQPDDGGDFEGAGEQRGVRCHPAEVRGITENLVPAEDDRVCRGQGFGDDNGCPVETRVQFLILDVPDDPVHHVVYVVRPLVHVVVGCGEHQMLVFADLIGDHGLRHWSARP